MGMFTRTIAPHTNLASVHLQQAGDTSKTIHRLWFSRGRALTKQGYYETALASFDAALRLRPGHCPSWIFRGVVLAHLKRYRSALASFDRALQLSPENREAWLFRGAVLKYLNCHHEAMHSYNTALRMHQETPILCQDYPLWVPAIEPAIGE